MVVRRQGVWKVSGGSDGGQRGRMGSVCIDPLNPLRIGKENAKGFRMTPPNLSELIC